jgi:hypothetical protein
MPLKTVVIADPDLGFVFWLGRMLEKDGYQVLPAKSVPDAASLADQYQASLTLVIVNPSLSGGTNFVAGLCRIPHVKVIAVTDRPTMAVPQSVDLVKNKPLDFDDRSAQDWLYSAKAILSAESGRAWSGTNESHSVMRTFAAGASPISENPN